MEKLSCPENKTYVTPPPPSHNKETMLDFEHTGATQRATQCQGHSRYSRGIQCNRDGVLFSCCPDYWFTGRGVNE